MSLLEVVVALGVMSILIASVLGGFLQTRKLAAASVSQSCAITIVQGYIEQLKNIPLQDFVNADPTDSQNNPRLTTSFVLPTMKDQTNTAIQLSTTPSTVALATMTGATPGTTSTGVVDNLQSFDMDSRGSSLPSTWTASWPGANTTLTPYPSTAPGRTDLRMNFWVQITDLTPTAASKCKAYGIVIVYTWQYLDGNKMKYSLDSVRSIRSAVQTF